MQVGEPQGQDTRANDLKKLVDLRAEQQNLIQYFSKSEETIELKVNKLAEIIEERINYADPLFISEGLKDFTINMISTYIADLFRREGIKCADNVHHYLPMRFKNASQVRNNVIEARGIQYRETFKALQLLTQNRGVVLEILEDVKKTDHHLIQESYNLFHKGEIKTEQIALAEGIKLEDLKQRSETNTQKPEPRVTTYSNSILHLIESLTDFHEFVIQFPPPPELDKKFAAGTEAWASLYPSYKNLKNSLTVSMWISRCKYMIHQSKHGAAVKDEVMTNLCVNCSDPDHADTWIEMVWDWKSETYWRCTECGGTKGEWRGLTREQVGDNKAPIHTQAEFYANNLPGAYESLEYYNTIPIVYKYARKVKLGVTLSEEA